VEDIAPEMSDNEEGLFEGPEVVLNPEGDMRPGFKEGLREEQPILDYYIERY
jgi:hypothetical protein